MYQKNLPRQIFSKKKCEEKNVLLNKICHGILRKKLNFLQRQFCRNFFCKKNFPPDRIFLPKIIFLKKFYQKYFLQKINFVYKKFFTQDNSVQNFFFNEIIFCKKILQEKICGKIISLKQIFLPNEKFAKILFCRKFSSSALIRPSSRLTVSAWVSPSSTQACCQIMIDSTKLSSSRQLQLN